MVVFVSHFDGIVEGALVAVHGYLVAKIVTFISYHQEIGVGIEMEAVSVWPKERLHDWGQWKERGLVQNGLGNPERVRRVLVVTYS